jgi:hypothetical protein
MISVFPFLFVNICAKASLGSDPVWSEKFPAAPLMMALEASSDFVKYSTARDAGIPASPPGVTSGSANSLLYRAVEAA